MNVLESNKIVGANAINTVNFSGKTALAQGITFHI